MNIEIIKCLKDNYSYLITDSNRNDALVIDPGEADPIIKTLDKKFAIYIKYTSSFLIILVEMKN